MKNKDIFANKTFDTVGTRITRVVWSPIFDSICAGVNSNILTFKVHPITPPLRNQIRDMVKLT